MALIILGICDIITFSICGVITYLIWRKGMVEEQKNRVGCHMKLHRHIPGDELQMTGKERGKVVLPSMNHMVRREVGLRKI